jgi:hypothetical protein
MLTFHWNALRAGDNVVMHDAAEATNVLFPGVVTAVSMRKGSNQVGIRVTRPDGGRVIVWPSRFVVHAAVAADCWRCQAA